MEFKKGKRSVELVRFIFRKVQRKRFERGTCVEVVNQDFRLDRSIRD